MNAGKWSNSAGLWVFFAGLIIMISAVIMGNVIQPTVSGLGMDAYLAENGSTGWLGFMLFAFGFPLGLGICATGLFSASGGKGARLLSFGLLLLVAALLPVLIPLLLGRQPDAAFFGTTGYILLLLIIVTLWLWGSHRAGLGAQERTTTDFQGAGYICFAMAAWNLCGVGGMPAYALIPERMLATGSSNFATGQMKAVMLLLLLGWLMTFFGYYQAARNGKNQASRTE